jgi:hypothetical protein
LLATFNLFSIIDFPTRISQPLLIFSLINIKIKTLQ